MYFHDKSNRTHHCKKSFRGISRPANSISEWNHTGNLLPKSFPSVWSTSHLSLVHIVTSIWLLAFASLCQFAYDAGVYTHDGSGVISFWKILFFRIQFLIPILDHDIRIMKLGNFHAFLRFSLNVRILFNSSVVLTSGPIEFQKMYISSGLSLASWYRDLSRWLSAIWNVAYLTIEFSIFRSL